MKDIFQSPARRFLAAHRYRLLMAGLLFLYSCDLFDDEVVSSRQAFLGSFQMNQSCNIGGGNTTDRYTLRIRSGSGGGGILLDNLEPFSDEIEATVSGNLLTIPSQTVPFGGRSIRISGSGSLTDGSVLEVDFEFDDGSGTSTCSATGYKL